MKKVFNCRKWWKFWQLLPGMFADLMGRHKGIKCSCWHTSWRKSNLYWHKVWKRGKWNVYYLHNLKDSVPSEVVNVSVSQFLETGQGHPKEVTLFVPYVKLLWDKILPCHIFLLRLAYNIFILRKIVPYHMYEVLKF